MRTPQESKFKDGLKTKDAVRQLQVELRRLQDQMGMFEATASDDAPKAREIDPGVTAVQYTITFQGNWVGVGRAKERTRKVSVSAIHRTSDVSAAEVGCALSSPKKIALLRILLDKGTVGSSDLGAATNLTTGSLYHHLRDVIHAGLVVQSARNQYQLTSRGARALLLMLAIASERQLGD